MGKKVSTFKIAATYIGTVIGAGFASGQEILQFFGMFGGKGILGLAIVTLFFIGYGYIVMDLGYRLQAPSYIEIIRLSGGKTFGIVADSIISFFLFSAVAAMIAAGGALVSQQFGIREIWGNLCIAIVTVVTVFAGIYGIINSLSLIVPCLLTLSIGVSVIYIKSFTGAGNPGAIPAGASVLMGNWLWSAILYVSYNIVTAIAILGPLGKDAKDRKSIGYGALLGGLGLGACATAIYFAVTRDLNSLLNVELPMVFIASRISYTVQFAYAIILLAGIYATAAGSLYGFSARVFDLDGPKGKILVVLVTVLAFAASQLGFSNLVKYMYPLEGYLGMILLVSLAYSRARKVPRE